MSMLGLQKIRSGTLQEARLGSMLFPLGDYSAHFLVTQGAEGQLFGVFLSGEYLFQTIMVAEDGDNWLGFFVDDVRIEVDIDSASDATHQRPALGSVVIRPNGAFLIATAGDRDIFRRRVEMRLHDIENSSAERSGVAFSRWNVVTGAGEEKVILRTVQATAET